MNRNRIVIALAVLFALLLTGIAGPAARASGAEEAETGGYATLQLGDAGEDVLRLKQRMFELGYFNSGKITNVFNETTRERLMDLQRKNGWIPADGIATPELQALIFSDACLGKNDPAAATPAPAPGETMPDPAGPDAPALAEDGYLPDGAEPYVYADRKQGVWTYVSHDVHVEIRQGTDRSVPHVWLEASIRVRDPACFTAAVNTREKTRTYKTGTYLSMPTTIAETSGAILACSDDFFGYRMMNSQKVGVVIRNGVVWSEKTKKGSSRVYPPLDLMAVFADGHMQTFESDAHTAQEYLDMGVVSTYAFGPILVQGGEVCADLKNWNSKDRAPRMAIGITADGTVKMLDVLGRRKDAVGVTFPWLAEKMLSIGCVEALNLDGGNTTCMIFMGDIINRPTDVKSKDIRTLNSMIVVREAQTE